VVSSSTTELLDTAHPLELPSHRRVVRHAQVEPSEQLGQMTLPDQPGLSRVFVQLSELGLGLHSLVHVHCVLVDSRESLLLFQVYFLRLRH
jgi:hypothetical protein